MENENDNENDNKNGNENGNKNEIVIREFQPGDYDAVIDIWKQAGLPYKPHGRDSKENMIPEMEKETATLLVAEHKKKIVGVILATHDGRKGWLNRLAVIPEYRYKNVARNLVETAEKSLYDRGLQIIACLIEEDNKMSMKFFKKAGYVKHDDIIYFSKRQHPDV